MTVAWAPKEAAQGAAGTTATPVTDGATSLVRMAGAISPVTAPGEISLARPVLRAMSASLRCHHRPEGMTTTVKTRGLGAIRSLA